MNCTDAHELAGPALDGHLSEQDRAAFQEHLRSCRVCRRDFELESSIRSFLRTAVEPVETPGAVRRSVVDAVRAEARSQQKAEGRDWWSMIFGRVPAPIVGLGLAVVLIAFALFPVGPNDDLIRHAAANDVINQAAENFQLIRDGKVKPAITSCSPEQVGAYLESQRMPFHVDLRPMERCDGYSAVVNDYHGVRLAHVVYKIGDELLYVLQVQKDEALGREAHLTMPPAAREAIERTGWYTDPQHPDCNVVMWEDGGTLCAAASTMQKEKMMAVLASR